MPFIKEEDMEPEEYDIEMTDYPLSVKVEEEQQQFSEGGTPAVKVTRRKAHASESIPKPLDRRTVAGRRCSPDKRISLKDKKFKCVKCAYSTNLKSNLKCHESSSHSSKREVNRLSGTGCSGLYPCDQCSYKGKNLSLFKRHIMSHFEEKKIKCPHCSYSTNFNSYMIEHLRTHVNTRPFKCSMCPFASKLKSNLKKHEANHLKKTGITRFHMLKKCHKCDFLTANSIALQSHLRSHSTEEVAPSLSIALRPEGNRLEGPRPRGRKRKKAAPKEESNAVPERPIKGPSVFRKQAQARVFGTRTNLRHNSMRKAVAGLLRKCPKCDFRSNKTSVLNRHKLRHVDKNKKKYDCPSCDSSFNTKRLVTKHLAETHEVVATLEESKAEAQCAKDKDKELGCDQCSFSTKIKDLMDKHVCNKSQKSLETPKLGSDKPKKDDQFRRKTRSSLDLNLEGANANPNTEDKKPKIGPDEKSSEIPVVQKRQRNKFKCSNCNFETVLRKILRRHMSKNRSIKCSLCEYTSNSECFAGKHEITHLEVRSSRKLRMSGRQRIKCSECDALEDLDQESRASEKEGFKCSRCKSEIRKNTRNKFEVADDMSSAKATSVRHLNAPLAQDAKIKDSLKLSTKSTKEHSSKICTKKEKINDGNKVGPKPSASNTFKCPTCDFTTSKKYFMAKHECENVAKDQSGNGHHKDSAESKPKLAIDREKGAKLLKCSVCHYSTKHKNLLTRHQAVHLDDQPLKCSHCSYRTKFQLSLKLHVKWHARRSKQTKRKLLSDPQTTDLGTRSKRLRSANKDKGQGMEALECNTKSSMPEHSLPRSKDNVNSAQSCEEEVPCTSEAPAEEVRKDLNTPNMEEVKNDLNPLDVGKVVCDSGNGANIKCDLGNEQVKCDLGNVEEIKCDQVSEDQVKCDLGNVEEFKCDQVSEDQVKCDLGNVEEIKCDQVSEDQVKCDLGNMVEVGKGLGDVIEVSTGVKEVVSELGCVEEVKSDSGNVEEIESNIKNVEVNSELGNKEQVNSGLGNVEEFKCGLGNEEQVKWDLENGEEVMSEVEEVSSDREEVMCEFSNGEADSDGEGVNSDLENEEQAMCDLGDVEEVKCDLDNEEKAKCDLEDEKQAKCDLEDEKQAKCDLEDEKQAKCNLKDEKQAKCGLEDEKQANCDLEDEKQAKCDLEDEKQAKCDLEDEKQAKCDLEDEKQAKCDLKDEKQAKCDLKDEKQAKCGFEDEKQANCDLEDEKQAKCDLEDEKQAKCGLEDEKQAKCDLEDEKQAKCDLEDEKQAKCDLEDEKQAKCDLEDEKEAKCDLKNEEKTESDFDYVEEFKCDLEDEKQTKCELGNEEIAKCDLEKDEEVKCDLDNEKEVKSDLGNEEEFKCDLGYVEEVKNGLDDLEVEPDLNNVEEVKCDVHPLSVEVPLEKQELNPSNELFVCSTCSYKCSTKDLLLKHEMTHSQSKHLKCSECPYETNAIRNLRRHEKIHLKRQAVEDILKCNKCEFVSRTETVLRDHILSHFESVTEEVASCSSPSVVEVSSASNLNSESKTFKCSHCDKSYKQKRSLKRHSYIHLTSPSVDTDFFESKDCVDTTPKSESCGSGSETNRVLNSQTGSHHLNPEAQGNGNAEKKSKKRKSAECNVMINKKVRSSRTKETTSTSPSDSEYLKKSTDTSPYNIENLNATSNAEENAIPHLRNTRKFESPSLGIVMAEQSNLAKLNDINANHLEDQDLRRPSDVSVVAYSGLEATNERQIHEDLCSSRNVGERNHNTLEGSSKVSVMDDSRAEVKLQSSDNHLEISHFDSFNAASNIHNTEVSYFKDEGYPGAFGFEMEGTIQEARKLRDERLRSSIEAITPTIPTPNAPNCGDLSGHAKGNSKYLQSEFSEEISRNSGNYLQPNVDAVIKESILKRRLVAPNVHSMPIENQALGYLPETSSEHSYFSNESLEVKEEFQRPSQVMATGSLHARVSENQEFQYHNDMNRPLSNFVNNSKPSDLVVLESMHVKHSNVNASNLGTPEINHYEQGSSPHNYNAYIPPSEIKMMTHSKDLKHSNVNLGDSENQRFNSGGIIEHSYSDAVIPLVIHDQVHLEKGISQTTIANSARHEVTESQEETWKDIGSHSLNLRSIEEGSKTQNVLVANQDSAILDYFHADTVSQSHYLSPASYVPDPVVVANADLRIANQLVGTGKDSKHSSHIHANTSQSFMNSQQGCMEYSYVNTPFSNSQDNFQSRVEYIAPATVIHDPQSSYSAIEKFFEPACINVPNLGNQGPSNHPAYVTYEPCAEVANIKSQWPVDCSKSNYIIDNNLEPQKPMSFSGSETLKCFNVGFTDSGNPDLGNSLIGLLESSELELRNDANLMNKEYCDPGRQSVGFHKPADAKDDFALLEGNADYLKAEHEIGAVLQSAKLSPLKYQGPQCNLENAHEIHERESGKVTYTGTSVLESPNVDYVSHSVDMPERTLFSCFACSYKANTIDELEKHKVIHSNQELFMCSKCSFTSHSEDFIWKHEMAHSQSKHLKCSECPYETNAIRNLRRHEKIHLKRQAIKDILKCNKCEFVSHTETVLRDHMLSHFEVASSSSSSSAIFPVAPSSTVLKSERKTFKCLQCDKIYKQKRSLKKHSLTHLASLSVNDLPESKDGADPALTSEFLGDALETSARLTGHLGSSHVNIVPSRNSSVSEPKPKKRKINGSQIKNKKMKPNSKNRMGNKSKIRKKNTTIGNGCSSTSKKKTSSTKKLKIKSSGNKSSELSGKISKSQKRKKTEKDLQLPKCIIIQPGNEKCFMCTKCDFTSESRYSAKGHELVHFEDKHLKCQKCDYATNLKRNLKQHELVHLSVKRYKCSHCDYTSNFRTVLKKHQLRRHPKNS